MYNNTRSGLIVHLYPPSSPFLNGFRSAAQLRGLKRTTVIASVFSMLLLNIPFAAAAPVDLLSDSFGTGGTDSTFGESPDTSVGSHTWSEDEAGAEKREAASGNDSASNDGDRFAVVFGDDGELCIQVDASGYNDVQVSYEWRGDSDAESGDDGIVEFRAVESGVNCGSDSSGSGWTELAEHDLSDDAAWTTQSAITDAGMNNVNFYLRFRVDSSQNDEHLRIDGLTITGEPIVNDQDTAAILPASVGSYDQWFANSGTKVDAVQANDGDTTYITRTSGGDIRQTFVFNGAGIPDGSTVHSVTLYITAREESGDDAGIQPLAEIGTGGSEREDLGEEIELTDSYVTYSRFMNVNPLTSAAWTADEVNTWDVSGDTLAFGVQRTDDDPRVTEMYLVVSYTDPSSVAEEEDGPGGVNGKRRRDQNIIRFLTGQANVGFGENNLPSESFGGPGPGGGTGELSQEQHITLCGIRDQISLLAASYYTGVVGGNLAHVWDVPLDAVMDVLENGTGCDEINAAKAEQEALEAAAAAQAEAERVASIDAAIKAERAAYQGAPVEFDVAMDGYPVSSDPVWNVCIRNMQVFVQGEDKPVSCRKYHDGHAWTHPDTLVTFKWTDRLVKEISVQGKLVAINEVATPVYIAEKNMQFADTATLYTFESGITTKAQQVVASAFKKITKSILAFMHN